MAKKPKTPAAPEVPAVSEQPYYLQRAHIKDFRSIRDAKVEFKPGLNIIIGPNGSGKTNFVRVASNGIDISGSQTMNDTSSFALSGRNDFLISYEKKINEHQHAELFDVDFQAKYKRQVTVKTAKGIGVGETVLAAILANYTSIFSEGTSFVYKSLVIEHGLPEPYPIIDKPNDFLVSDLDVYHTMSAKFPASILGAIASSFLPYMLDKSNGKVTLQIVQNNLKAIAVYFLNGITAGLKRFTPVQDIKLVDSASVYYNKQQEQYIARGLSVEFKIAGSWLPFSALSSGTQRLFYIVSELAIPNGMSISLNKVSTLNRRELDRIIFIEEPELGIHPDQLHKLLQFMREQSEKHQLIITTHSPQVLDMLKDDELDRITICELDEKKGTQFRKLKKAQIATAKKYMTEVGFLSDYWRYGSLEENI